MIHLSTTSRPRRARWVTAAAVIWVWGSFVIVSSFGSLFACQAFSVHPSTTATSRVVVSTSWRTGSTRGNTVTSQSRRSVVLQALSPEQFDPVALDQWMQHVSSASSSSAASSITSATTALDSFVSSSPAWSSQWLADAAAAAAGDAPEKIGWWQQYLLIFKGALTLVHNTIDGPLRSLGIEHTWGPSIAIFTALARGLLVPFSIQQSKSAEYMKALRPYMTEIRQKFKDNQDAQNRAIGKLYEDANQNPLAGCFTSLAQLPIFLGLYRGVRLLALDGELQEPFLWIPSLEGPVSPPDYRGLDWLTQGWTTAAEGGLPTPAMGWETTLAFLAMPVILVCLQTLTMRALQPPIDENSSAEERETMEKSQGILRFLPLMIGFFSLQVPAGLTIYWFTSNIFTLTQSLLVKAYFAANPPQINLPDYWDQALKDDADFESMTPAERRRAVEAGIRIGPTFQDMLDEATFHCFIERGPLRQDSEAWNRVLAATNAAVAAELDDWVKSAGSVMASSSSEQQQHANGAVPGSNTSSTTPFYVEATQSSA